MKMSFGEVFEIEDLGNHLPSTIIRLGVLLAGTVNATPDPNRRCFYEIEGGSTVYYVYVSPSTGKISFLASWPKIVRSAQELAAGFFATPEACSL